MVKKQSNYWTYEKCKEVIKECDNIGDFKLKYNYAYRVIIINKWSELYSHYPKIKKWDYEACKEETLVFNYKKDLIEKSKTCYNSLLRNGWLDELCSHMIEIQKPNNYWTYENCKIEAIKYNNKVDFKKCSSVAYNKIYKKKWLDLLEHMIENQKPNNYWNYENCKEEALKYKHKVDFGKSSGSAYNSAIKNGWLDDICFHMTPKENINFYWNYDRCKEEALKYNMRTIFKCGSRGAYKTSCKNGWLNDICSHMVEVNKPNGYWDIELCQTEALKYTTRQEFSKNSKGAYQSARKNKWLDSICSHMNRKYKPSNYWDYDRCKEDASKYKHRYEYQKKSQSSYNSAFSNNWIDDICSHMESCGNLYKRLVYVYEFEDNYAYIGLTFDKEKRYNNHMKIGPVSKHIKETLLIPNYIILSDYIDVGDAQELEHTTKLKYIEDGWNVLNKGKTGRGVGSLGTSIFTIYTKEMCQEEALKYNTRSEYSNEDRTSYTKAIKNGWLDDICKHMFYRYKKWTLEMCKEEAKKYENKTELNKNNRNCYGACRKNNWFNELIFSS